MAEIRTRPINILTVDLEDWFQGTECIKLPDFHKFEDRIDASVNKLLAILDDYNVKATFFVLGWLAERKPDLILKIYHHGHEIATHGYSHELIYNQTPAEFYAELTRAITACEDITGHKVIGHRASNWSITGKSLWALDILKSCGIKYDSSIFPTHNYLFGIPDAPRFKYIAENGLVEFPPSTICIGSKTIPFSGGFFFRIFPYFFIHWAISRINRQGEPAVMYLHPWEMDICQPRNLPVPVKNRFIHYFGINKVEKRLRKLLTNFKFGRMDRAYLDFCNAPALPGN